VDEFDEDEFASYILGLVDNSRQRRQISSNFVVVFIAPTPRINNGSLEIAFFVQNSQGMLFSGTVLLSEIEDNEDDLLNAVSYFL